MKRTYDNAMGSMGAQQISAGLITTQDPVYYATNMVYTGNEDINVDHGISANFSQTRILPIVGRTSKAEVAVESADIQTKSLPIFQPQVKLGTDINELIYEVGVSSEWRGSMLKLPADTTPLPTLIQESGEDALAIYQSTTIRDPLTNSETNLQTFTNNSDAIGTLVDAYGLNTPVSLIPENLYDYSFPSNLNVQTLAYQPPDQNGNNYVWDNFTYFQYITLLISGNPIFTWLYNVESPLTINIKLSGITSTALSFLIHNTSSQTITVTFTGSDTTQPNQLVNSNQIFQFNNAGSSPGAIYPAWTFTNLTGSILGSPASNTILDSLFQYWNGSFKAYNPTTEVYGHSEIASTCLTPVCVGSVVQKINGCGLFESNIEYPTSMVVPIQSTDGFKAGDRVRFFGMSDIAVPDAYIPTVFGTVLDVISYNQLQNPSVDLSPALIVDYFPRYTVVSAVNPLVTAGPPPVYSSNSFTVLVQANYTFDGNALYVGQRITLSNFALSGTVDLNGVYSIASITIPPLNATTPIPANQFQITITTPFAVPTSAATTFGGGTITVSSAFTGGYVINPNSKDGGRIQFLTNEHAFRPRTMSFVSCVAGSNQLILSTNMSFSNGVDLFNTGWFKGCGVETNTNVENFPLDNVVVQLTLTPPANSIYGGVSTVPNFPTLVAGLNGYYRIVSRTFTSEGTGGIVNFTLIPLNASVTTFAAAAIIATGLYNPITFTMQLAPNFYSFDTRADYVIDDRLNNSVNELSFLRSIGYKPTTDLVINTPTYPPTALVPDTTWDRAFTVSWSFSSYQNLKWTPQNTTSRLPNQPLFVQDFGVNSNSSTYYNVYEINKFINSCVNPGIKNLYTDYTDSSTPSILELKSLNTQLELAYNGYKTALTQLTPSSTSYVWSSLTTYNYGDIVVDKLIDGGFVYMATKQLLNQSLPSLSSMSYDWMRLGPVPALSGSSLFNALVVFNGPSTPANYTLSYFKVFNTAVVPNNRYVDQMLLCTGLAKTSLLRDVPVFKTLGPTFIYDERTLLLSWTLDNYGFATNQTPYTDQEASDVATLSYKRLSWGDKTSDEFMVFESNSSFKFLFDNFPAECISYQDSLSALRNQNPYVSGGGISAFPMISFWVWDSTSTVQTTGRYFTIFQSAESFSSCMSPVESIVIVSDNIPVAEQLTSPLYNLIDSSTSNSRSTDATALTNKIIGEIFLPYVPFQSARTVVKYEPFEMKFYTLLDTKAFKQLDYSLFYRHRITQELVPLIITNYGSVNIKFVFRPTST